MKRIIALLLALLAIVAFAACAGDNKNKDDASKDPNATSDGNNSEYSAYADAVAVLDAVWNKYPDDDKFSALGGNRDAMVDGKPGNFDLSAAEELTNSFLLPGAKISELKSAASLIHMINGNTFSAAVFQTDGDLDALSQILVDAANNKVFICGAPQVIVTLKVDSYLIMAFGADDLIETFKTHALEVEGIVLVHSGPVHTGGGNGGLGGPIPIG